MVVLGQAPMVGLGLGRVGSVWGRVRESSGICNICSCRTTDKQQTCRVKPGLGGSPQSDEEQDSPDLS